MPRDDNAVVLAAEAVRRLATPGEPRITSVCAGSSTRWARPWARTSGGSSMRQRATTRAGARLAIRALCDPIHARDLRALLRDTISPDVIHAGTKYNVIPGEATVEIDSRPLPGTTPDDMREELLARLGDLVPVCTLEHVHSAIPVETPVGDVYELLADTIRAHDPDGIPVPMMAPFATDAKHLVRLGVPTTASPRCCRRPASGSSTASIASTSGSGVDALRWGLPVLYDATIRFCG